MGKSTVADMFAKGGAPVFCADAVVRAALEPKGKAFKSVVAAFPSVLCGGCIDRAKLADLAFNSQAKKKRLESILHPLVWAARAKFLSHAAKENAPAVILDIPLLFETGAQAECDLVVCVSASAAVQKERVMKREGMTPARFRSIKARQMPDKEKRKLSDIVLRTDVSLAETRKQVRVLWRMICKEGLAHV